MDNSIERLQNLMGCVKENSPTAKETINAAFSRGCGFTFEVMDRCMGAYDSDRRMIILNPLHSNEDLMATLVHECRHASQPPKNVVLANNIRTNLQWSRTKEADAMAHECASCYEMKEKEPSVWQGFEKRQPVIAKAYQNACEKEETKENRLNQAFQAWHENLSYVSIYDKNVLDLMSAYANQAGHLLMTKDIAPEDIAEQICKKDGKSYVEKGFMTSPIALSIDEKNVYPQVMRMKSLAYGYTDIQDTSIEALYKKNGSNPPVCIGKENAVSQEKKQPQNAPLSNITLKTLKQKQSR